MLRTGRMRACGSAISRPDVSGCFTCRLLLCVRKMSCSKCHRVTIWEVWSLRQDVDVRMEWNKVNPGTCRGTVNLMRTCLHVRRHAYVGRVSPMLCR